MARTKKPQVRGAFAEEFDRFRDARDMTQKDIAEALDVSQAAVSMWLAGKMVPSPEKVGRLEHFLGANVGELEALIGRQTPPTKREWRKVTDVIKEIQPRRTSTKTSDIGTAEDVAMLLAGHTKESFERLFEATQRLRLVLGDAQKEMDELRLTVASELPGTRQFDDAVAKMSELSERMSRERAMFERQQIDIGDVDKMTERVKFVLGHTGLGTPAQERESTRQPGPVDMTVQVVRGEGRRRGRVVQTGLRSALFRWRHPSTEDRDGALDELLARLVNTVGMLQKETGEQQAELAELRGEVANLHALVMVMG